MNLSIDRRGAMHGPCVCLGLEPNPAQQAADRMYSIVFDFFTFLEFMIHL